MAYYMNATDKRAMEQNIRAKAEANEGRLRRLLLNKLQPPLLLSNGIIQLITAMNGMGYQTIIENGDQVTFTISDDHPAFQPIRGAADIQIAHLWNHREFNMTDAMEMIQDASVEGEDIARQGNEVPEHADVLEAAAEGMNGYPEMSPEVVSLDG